MLTGPQEEALHILKPFAKQARLLENNPSWDPENLRTQIDADGEHWDLFL